MKKIANICDEKVPIMLMLMPNNVIILLSENEYIIIHKRV